MYNIIINVIGWIAIVQFILLVFYHICIYVWFNLNSDCEYISIRRTTYFGKIHDGEFYIFPTISIRLTTMFKTIVISWLKHSLDITYRITTEEEEDLEAEIRMQIMNKNES